MNVPVDPTALLLVQQSLATTRYVSGKTSGFYHYPARFHPDIARAVIEAFSLPGDTVFDPFMGGGTSIVEALALGRRAVGIDINSLAHFVTAVRTTPLCSSDERQLTAWADCCEQLRSPKDVRARGGVRNLPRAIESFVSDARSLALFLRNERQSAFARCALLRLGQLAIDSTTRFENPRRESLARKLPVLVRDMIVGMQSFVAACRGSGLRKNRILTQRSLYNRSIVGFEVEGGVLEGAQKPRLVLTSPPYPGVHVLYHRWQYRGRRETAAAYWITQLQDGCGSSYYTMGDIKPPGVEDYFTNMLGAFRSVRALVADDAWVVQLVGFGDVAAQLPRYLEMMKAAGFRQWSPPGKQAAMLRSVPNRRWYTHLQGPVDASRERLLIHRPSGFRN